MPDKRTHRGAHPEDAKLFAPDQWAVLRQAVRDYSLLLSKGYADKSSLKLVGDHFALRKRQRTAIMRCGCSDYARTQRQQKQFNCAELDDKVLLLDGYNVITTVEAALAGGLILIGRDGCFRDLASVHGTYRKVEETIPAINLIGQFIAQAAAKKSIWYLDSPVSNSGRLKVLLLDLAQTHNWNWLVELVYSPDGILSHAADIVATSDSVILDNCSCWLNLAREIIETYIPDANLVDISCFIDES